MPNKYIYKGGDLENSLGVSRAVVAHFTKDGVFKVCQDGVIVRAIPCTDVEVVTANKTLTPAENGKAVLTNKVDGIVVTLPKASYGKMTFRIGVHTLGTSGDLKVAINAADYIKGFNLGSHTIAYAIKLPSATDAIGDFVDLTSDGINTWWITAANGSWATNAGA